MLHLSFLLLLLLFLLHQKEKEGEEEASEAGEGPNTARQPEWRLLKPRQTERRGDEGANGGEGTKGRGDTRRRGDEANPTEGNVMLFIF